MKLKIFLFTIVSFLVFSFSGESYTKIDGNNLDQELLEEMILEKVNSLRKKKKKSILKSNKTLKLSAQDQADYLKQRKKLSHNQSTRKKKTPLDRAEFYGGKFKYVGENIAFTYLNESVEGAKVKRNSIVLKSYETTAEYFFQLWKNSKGHYVNMVDKDFNLSGIRFSFDSKSNKIFGVQVFGSL